MEYGADGTLINYTDAYVGLFQEMGQTSGHNEMSLTPLQYRSGFTLWAFDITKGHSSGDYDPGPSSQGSCSLKITFEPRLLKENVVIYAILLYHKSFKIYNLKNDFRNVEFLEK